MFNHLPYKIALALLFLLLAGCQSAEVEPPPTADPPEEADAPAAEGEGEESSSAWTVIHEVPAEHAPSLALFTQPENPEFGVSYCKTAEEEPKPYFTMNAGASWSKSGEYNRSCPIGMAVAEDDLVWTCNRIAIWSFEEGGQSWKQLTFPSGLGPCEFLSLVDASHAWAASFSRLMVTSDGGNSWEMVALPEEIGKIAAISLSSPEAGHILDDNLSVYSTANGGQDWSVSQIEIEDSELNVMDLGKTIAFSSETTGVVVLNLAGGGNSILAAYHTNDGGQTWEQQVIPADLGAVSLTRDAAYLTAAPMSEPGVIYILENQR